MAVCEGEVGSAEGEVQGQLPPGQDRGGEIAESAGSWVAVDGIVKMRKAAKRSKRVKEFFYSTFRGNLAKTYT